MKAPCPPAAAAFLLALGCGGERGERAGPAGPTTPFIYSTCALGTKVGELKVGMAERFTAVSGSIAEAVVPAAVRELVAESGGCRLLRMRQLRCDPPCAAGMTCAEAGRCERYPDNLSAGAITVTGLRRPVTMAPRAPGNLYWDTELPHPGFDPGAEIQARAQGGAVPAFSLRGRGVTALAIPAQDLLLESERDFAIRWTAGPAGPARVVLTINIDQHGVTPATLVCEAPDDGAFAVPAALVTALQAAGASGYPKALVARQTADSVTVGPGCVELLVTAELERSLRVAGHLPCTTDADCPTGTRCATGEQTCRAPGP